MQGRQPIDINKKAKAKHTHTNKHTPFPLPTLSHAANNVARFSIVQLQPCRMSPECSTSRARQLNVSTQGLHYSTCNMQPNAYICIHNSSSRCFSSNTAPLSGRPSAIATGITHHTHHALPTLKGAASCVLPYSYNPLTVAARTTDKPRLTNPQILGMGTLPTRKTTLPRPHPTLNEGRPK